MVLTEDGSLGEDSWRHLGDDEAVPESDAVTVSFARWKKANGELHARNGKLGLRLPNDTPPEKVAPDLGRFDLILLHFPKFTDGRAYSQARLLRERYGYKGELRASGNVLRDQLLFMRRCGFNSFVVDERAVREDWTKAFGEFDVFYQGAADSRPWVMRQRMKKAQ
jgi:uncharacterized protein (DUF934 family)